MSTENSSLSLSSLLSGQVASEPVVENLADAIITKATDPATPAADPLTPATPEKGSEPEGADPEPGTEPVTDPETPEGDPETPEGEGDEPETFTAETFYATLDALHGVDINAGVDYGETDPMSPEGVFIREQHIRDLSMEEFANSMKENDPRAYSYFLHRSNGGSDDEFFSAKSFVLPDLQEVRDNVDLQRDLYEQVLLNRGNSPKQVAAIIKMAIEDGELLTEAETAYKAVKENESKVALQAEAKNKAIQQKRSADTQEIGDALNSVLDSNSALKFIIPKAEKEMFSEVLRKQIQYENGNFFIVKPLSKENMAAVVEAELFSYLKGDVSKLVNKKATTVAAVRTLNRIKAKPVVGSTSTPEAGITLKQIL
jgi:hypothetical protein